MKYLEFITTARSVIDTMHPVFDDMIEPGDLDDWEDGIWEGISANLNTTLQDVLENPDKPWNWEYLSRNPNITLKDIQDYPDKPWQYFELSANPNLTIQFVLDYPDEPWNWSWISKNPNISMCDILAHLDQPWEWEWISKNPNWILAMFCCNPNEVISQVAMKSV